MSRILESALDPQRRADCEAADRRETRQDRAGAAETVGRYVCTHYRERAAQAGTQAAARQLRKQGFPLALALSILATTQLAGCWFVFIPGSLIAHASDAITGDSGEHCVSRSVSPGQTIKLTTGQTEKVQSVSGASVRCQDSAYPIRAAVGVNP